MSPVWLLAIFPLSLAQVRSSEGRGWISQRSFEFSTAVRPFQFEATIQPILEYALQNDMAIHMHRNCSHPIKIDFNKCGQNFLRSNPTVIGDHLGFQDEWLPFLLNETTYPCREHEGNEASFTIAVFPTEVTQCRFVFKVTEKIPKKTGHPSVYHAVNQAALQLESYKFNIDIDSLGDDEYVQLKHTFKSKAYFLLGKCGYIDPHALNERFDLNDQMNRLRRMRKLYCDKDMDDGFLTLVSSETNVSGYFYYEIADSKRKHAKPTIPSIRGFEGFRRKALCAALIFLGVGIASMTVNVCLNSDGVGDEEPTNAPYKPFGFWWK
ncbi:unnamed protein product [Caenorhabditis sp. 36 PRJEB53466]|nr:unnamed protein product [Caenorhabditis sp. 36 PRJEB53466]